ncbi:MAG: hexose kinase [Candidatus Aenigmatarchaeota archaeon]
MILTITFNPAIDHTYILEEDIEDGEVSRTDDSRFDAGGKGINVASYLDALGQETIATGPLGGFTGNFIREELEEYGLAHDFVEGGRARINTTVVAGEKEYKINHNGPDAGEELVDRIISKIHELDPEMVVISGSLLPNLDYKAIEQVKNETNIDVAVDLPGDVLGKLEGDYFVAKPNENELSEATGIEVNSVEDAVKASRKLLDRGFNNVLASLGEKGAVLVTPEENLYAEGLEADVADTTGAGDAGLSGFLAGISEGREHALKQGLAFATLVVETHGTGVPDLDKLEDYIEKTEIEEL